MPNAGRPTPTNCQESASAVSLRRALSESPPWSLTYRRLRPRLDAYRGDQGRIALASVCLLSGLWIYHYVGVVALWQGWAAWLSIFLGASACVLFTEALRVHFMWRIQHHLWVQAIKYSKRVQNVDRVLDALLPTLRPLNPSLALLSLMGIGILLACSGLSRLLPGLGSTVATPIQWLGVCALCLSGMMLLGMVMMRSALRPVEQPVSCVLFSPLEDLSAPHQNVPREGASHHSDPHPPGKPPSAPSDILDA